jgi:hypothetical protein
MAKLHFFTDIDLLSAQASGDEFGYATQSGGNDVFQVTSLHNASNDPNAYAVCSGTVFVQDVANSSGLVNLILQPTLQPPFAFPKIKFFIYRGIKMSSLINGNDIAIANTNDLTQSLWNSQTARNASANTNDNPPKEALGIDLDSSVSGFADTDPIDNAFYRTGVNFQLPFVKGGWKIGTFDKNGFGFEIMLESIGFNPELGTIRNVANNNNVNNIEVPTLASNPSQPDFFEHWHDKEQILNYVDPCAFWGSFYHNKLKVIDSNGNTYKRGGNDVYTFVLDGKFINKNKIYVDIRNEYNFSINYFKNYGVSLTDVQIDLVIYDELNSIATKNYYASGWPLLVLSPTDFNVNNTTAKNVLNIALPYGSGENNLPTIFISVGTKKKDFPKETKDKNKLIDADNNTDSSTDVFSDEIAIAIPNNNSLSATTPICFYVRLKYLKRLDVNPPASSDTVIRAQNYMDNLFAPFDMKIPFAGTANVMSAVYDEEMFVDAKDVLNSDFISQVGIIDDNKNYVFIAFPNIVRKEDELVADLISFLSESSNVFNESYEYILSKTKNKTIIKSFFQLSPTKDYLEFADIGQGQLSKFNSPSIDQLIAIGIDQNEFNSISTSVFLNKYRIFLGFGNEQIGVDNIGQTFKSFDVIMKGYELNSGIIQMNELLTNIKIYFNV